MNLVHKAFAATTETLTDKRQVRVIVSTGDVDRSGEIIVPKGIQWAAYMATGAGPVLWNHNPNMPIAKCIDIGLQGNQIVALVQFPLEGEDPQSDLYYNKIKFGSVPGVSIGFQPADATPLDKGNPVDGPQKYLSCDMMEFSFTPIPCNPNAIVVDKNAKGTNWKVGASRNLPMDDDGASGSDGDIFAAADFDSDSPDTTFARKGFLAYDAANPDDRSSYRLRFAKMLNGRLAACPVLIKAARAELLTANLPDEAAAKAAAVLDHYEGIMTKAAAKTVIKAGAEIKIKSLWHIAQLANILEDIAWLKECVEWECVYEEDGSQMPATLGQIMQEMGAALIAMTQEEVAELLKEESAEAADTVIKGYCAAGASPLVKAVVAVHVKTGRKFSASSITTMQDACKAIKDGHDALQKLIDAEPSDTDGDQTAEADTVKAAQRMKIKRMREADILRLSQPL
ncbi:hypothetical protein ACQZ4Q_08135 [Agrobacterium vitis]